MAYEVTDSLPGDYTNEPAMLRLEPALSPALSTIRVWSMQHLACWELFQNRGLLYADGIEQIARDSR